MSHYLEPKTMADIFSDIWNGKFFIAVGAAVGLLCAFVFILSATPHYRSEIMVSPANPMNGAEASSLLADENLFALRYIAQRAGPPVHPIFSDLKIHMMVLVRLNFCYAIPKF